MLNKINILILMVLVWPFWGSAQSVESFIEMAKSYNPSLKALKLDYEAALQKVDQVQDFPDPKINMAIGVLPIETRLGAQRLKLGISQSIPWKGSLNALGEVERSKANVLSNIDQIKEIDIEFAIRTAYSSLQYMEDQKAIVRQRLKILDVMEELSKSALRSGKGQLSNVLLIERKRELLEANLSLISKKMEQTIITINRWAGRELDSQIELEVDHSLIIDSEEISNKLETTHPKFQMYENQKLAFRSISELTNYQSKPKISVGLDYSLIIARSDIDIPFNGRDVIMPMASVTIPIHKSRFSAIKQEQKLKNEAISALISEAIDDYKAEIRIANSKIEYAQELISKYESLKNITKETLQLMRSEYASEGTRFEELLRLEMELIDYDQEIFSAQYEINLAFATLYKFN